MITADQLVNREVHYCVSALVSTLANAYTCFDVHRQPLLKDVDSLADQAFELCAPINDYEEAAIQIGYSPQADGTWMSKTLTPVFAASAQDACEAHNEEPYQREVFEHWIVSDWLADKLAEKGEKVDKDFAGMTVWARTTTGQGIASDSVIEAILADMAKGA